MKLNRRIKKINELLLSKVQFRDEYTILAFGDEGCTVCGEYFDDIEEAIGYIVSLKKLDPISAKLKITIIDDTLGEDYEYDEQKGYVYKDL